MAVRTHRLDPHANEETKAIRTVLAHGGRASEDECGFPGELRCAALFPRSGIVDALCVRGVVVQPNGDRIEPKRDRCRLVKSYVIWNLRANSFSVMLHRRHLYSYQHAP